MFGLAAHSTAGLPAEANVLGRFSTTLLASPRRNGDVTERGIAPTEDPAMARRWA